MLSKKTLLEPYLTYARTRKTYSFKPGHVPTSNKGMRMFMGPWAIYVLPIETKRVIGLEESEENLGDAFPLTFISHSLDQPILLFFWGSPWTHVLT